ncbi:putative DMT superfamily transporter inner membrane protein [Caballeronia choica]|uniref:DMT superfamily transporter inner membrane protein n=1 Tax=Caballeronia choica TaxID=326476 RepID=A0A158J2V0_9BURK|nr:DMT family transporter [Caballeronia choica]SAL62689.1 putative DMT superfamily transporter inner membrane protein [Caballeronia choica]
MRKTYIAFLLLGIFWGSNFIYMKWAGEFISAGQISLLRVFFAFVVVLALAWQKKVLSFEQIRYAHHFAVLAALATAFTYFSMARGTSLLPSGIAGVLGATPPLFTALAAHVFLRQERMNGLMVLGVGLGLAGITLISRPCSLASAGGSLDMQGVAWLLSGAMAFGLSYVYVRMFMSGINVRPIAIVTWQMGIALLMLLCATDLSGIGRVFSDWRAAIGLAVGLGVLGTGASLFLYYLLLEELSAVAAASAIYITPVVSLAIGWAVGEQIGLADAFGVALIFCCIAALELGRQVAGSEEPRVVVNPPTAAD